MKDEVVKIIDDWIELALDGESLYDNHNLWCLKEMVKFDLEDEGYPGKKFYYHNISSISEILDMLDCDEENDKIVYDYVNELIDCYGDKR